MRGRYLPTVGILADDLTGGADAAAPFLDRGMSVRVVRDGSDAPARPAADVVVFVSNSRDSSLPQARRQVSRGLAQIVAASPELVIKKIDSTLRGHLGFELSLACQVLEPELVLVAPAFPAHGRRLVGGQLVLDGVERPGAPLPELLAGAGLVVESLGLEEVRSAALTERLAATAPGSVVVGDAERDEDLGRLVAAALALGRRVLWVGSGGLAAALAARFAAVRPLHLAEATAGDGPLLVVVGSWSERAQDQARLLEGVCRTVLLGAGALASGEADLAGPVRAALGAGADVLIRPEGPLDPQRSAAVARGLARVVVACRADYRGLVLTGGATADAVLDGLGAGHFHLLREIEAGIPLAVAPDGLPFVTKAGGFGDGPVLQRCLAALHGELAAAQS